MAVVASFDEVLLDPFIVTAASGSPEFANTIIRNPVTGIYKINVNRFDALETFVIDLGLLNDTQRDYLARFWRGGYGSAYGFRAKLWSDYKMLDEVWGTGNAIQTVFPLIKTYTRPGTVGHADIRRIIKPVVTTNLTSGSATLYEADGVTPRVVEVPFAVKLNAAVQASGWTVKNTTGEITFAAAPGSGVIVSGNAQFDVPMRFLQNSFQQKLDVASDVSGMTLVEILPAELGVV